jgi:Mlc titration factor MtfA (ptsG expression regulator)
MPFTDPFYLLAIALFVGANILFLRSIWRLFYFPKADARAMDRFYRQHSLYYSKLDDRLKKRFLQRAYSFTKSLKIVGRMGAEVTLPVKLMVVAAIVQITFGFQQYFLKKFRTVFVYPDSFRNPHTGNVHDGEVHPGGLISFSLKKLLKGFDDPYDAVNLGLHEMAHALMHTILTSNSSMVNLKAVLNDVLAIAKVEMEKINSGGVHIFRSYAGANASEFFAVAVEHFFENPKNLQSELPDLYSKLAVLLNQDPVHNNYCIQ